LNGCPIKELGSEYEKITRDMLEEAHNQFGRVKNGSQIGEVYEWQIDLENIETAVEFIDKISETGDRYNFPFRLRWSYSFEWIGHKSLGLTWNMATHNNGIPEKYNRQVQIFSMFSLTISRVCHVGPHFYFPDLASSAEFAKFISELQKVSPFELKIRNFKSVGVNGNEIMLQRRSISEELKIELNKVGIH
jgi:hypothetical protein